MAPRKPKPPTQLEIPFVDFNESHEPLSNLHSVRGPNGKLIFSTKGKRVAVLQQSKGRKYWVAFKASAEDISQSELATASVIVPLPHRAPVVETFLNGLGNCFPKRIADEEVGDALERIAKLKSRFAVWVAVIITVLFILANVVREYKSAVLGKKKGGS